MPLRQAVYVEMMDVIGSPPRTMELMAVPKAKLKPKKVSAVEPETIKFTNFANLDEAPMINGA